VKKEKKMTNYPKFVFEDGGVTTKADFVGLYVDHDGDTMVVLRPEGYGMYLRLRHPSKVSFWTPYEVPEAPPEKV